MMEVWPKLILGVAALILLQLFKTPIRKDVSMAVDSACQGRSLLILRIFQANSLSFLAYRVYSILIISRRLMDSAPSNPMDQVLLAENILQASLIGFFVFLLFTVEGLNHIVREQDSIEEIINHEEQLLEQRKSHVAEHLRVLGNEVAALKSRCRTVELACQMKSNELMAAKATELGLKRQIEAYHHEYDCLLEYNQNLHNQLLSIDSSLLQENHEPMWKTLKSSIIRGELALPWGFQAAKNGKTGLDRENEVEIRRRCYGDLVFGCHATSSARLRRPLNQH